MRWPVRVLALACACALAVAGASAADAGHGGKGNGGGKGHGHGKGKGGIVTTPATLPLRTAVFDPFLSGNEEAQGFGMIHAAGGTYVRIVAAWYQIAPAVVLPTFDAADPNSPGYSWGSVDAAVATAEAAGLTPILDLGAAPHWAIDPSTFGTQGPGTPEPLALGAFATALAAHFDGNHGAPAVHVFQVWNEPNHRPELSPVDGNSYRDMVNAAAAGIHGVNPANIVVAGALDPRGNEAPGKYTQAPLAFMRSFLCLSSGKNPKATCNDPVHIDAWSMHPYEYWGPTGKATGRDNVSVGDLGTMNALLQSAVKLGQVVSAKPVQFWVTEFSWDTSPPRPGAVPAALGAQWADEAFHQMWLSGVSLVTWFMLDDQGGTTPWQSGLYYHSTSLATAAPKPMLTAFEFPFVATLGKKGQVGIWGRDPTSASQVITIELGTASSGPFTQVAQIKANTYGIFNATLTLKATKKDWLVATVGNSSSSLPFPLKPPSTKHYSPWGSR